MGMTGRNAKIDVLLVGGGGREHAMAWALRKSSGLGKLICAPGNGGIAELAECVDVAADDVPGIVAIAKERGVGLVAIGPEAPLAAGLADELAKAGIRAFGPTKAGAMLESSKLYAKEFMRRHGVPTAEYAAFSDVVEAISYVRSQNPPIVVKSDGLAAGKGVVVAQSVAEAEAAVRAAMIDKAYGESAGGTVLIEECLTGKEMTVLAFCDGKTLSLMPCSQDHKRAYDGDAGPNTGGMGAFAPSPWYTPEIERECRRAIFEPTLRGLSEDGIDYRGTLYFGLMATPGGVKVIEYNARFGDPETQATLPLLKSDILEAFLAVADGRLDSVDIEWDNMFSVCVVLAAGGYPGKHETGKAIEIARSEMGRAMYFVAGAKRRGDALVTSGGRVLSVCATGSTLAGAAAAAYAGSRHVRFEGMRSRSDIGVFG